MSFNQSKDIRFKEKQDKLLKTQLEKEREGQLISEIEKTEKERIKKRGLKTLKQSGILDSYQYLLTSLCKYGLPTGDLYEFSALQVLRYEKKLKSQKKKDLDDRMKKREEQKRMTIDIKQKEANQSPEKIGKANKKPVEPNLVMVKLTMAQLKAIKEQVEEIWPKGQHSIELAEARILLKNITQVDLNDSQLNVYFKQKGQLLDKITRDQLLISTNALFLKLEKQTSTKNYQSQKAKWDDDHPFESDKPLPQNVNWAEVSGTLPTSKTDPAEKTSRKDLWHRIDNNQNGYVSLEEADAGLRDFMPKAIESAKPSILRAFQFAKGFCKSTKLAAEYVEQREFRVFLFALKLRFEFWEVFKKQNTGNDQKITVNDFTDAVGQIERHTGTILDANVEFGTIDKKKAGFVKFEEFIQWIIKRSLDQDTDDDPNER